MYLWHRYWVDNILISGNVICWCQFGIRFCPSSEDLMSFMVFCFCHLNHSIISIPPLAVIQFVSDYYQLLLWQLGAQSNIWRPPLVTFSGHPYLPVSSHPTLPPWYRSVFTNHRVWSDWDIWPSGVVERTHWCRSNISSHQPILLTIRLTVRQYASVYWPNQSAIDLRQKFNAFFSWLDYVPTWWTGTHLNASSASVGEPSGSCIP